jgi:protein-disulfide isomerase
VRVTHKDIDELYVKTGKVVFIYRDFPLQQQQASPWAALAARCVGKELGASKYWAMHDWLFANQQTWSGSQDPLALFKAQAVSLGMPTDKYDACLADQGQRQAVLNDLQEGLARGVQYTPTFYINNHEVIGVASLDEFKQAIDAAIAAAGK